MISGSLFGGYGIILSGKENNTLLNCGIIGFGYGIYLNSSSSNDLLENEISNNTVGIYSENSNSTINSNIVCGNIELDFDSINWLSSTGDNNTCENPGIWNDDGTIGCTNYCFFSPCDLNHDGIYVNDWNDLMTAYKCFLGIKKDVIV